VKEPAPGFERRFTRVVAVALSAFFALLGLGLLVVPLGTSGDSDCGTLVHSYVSWTRCGTSRGFALGGVLVCGLLAVVFALVAVRGNRPREDA
jgi:ABC-type Fe3+ transport system permease subunit